MENASRILTRVMQAEMGQHELRINIAAVLAELINEVEALRSEVDTLKAEGKCSR